MPATQFRIYVCTYLLSDFLKKKEKKKKEIGAKVKVSEMCPLLRAGAPLLIYDSGFSQTVGCYFKVRLLGTCSELQPT